jgi:hypothetical protein
MQNRGRHYFDILFKVTFFRCFATGCAGVHLDPLPASPDFACSLWGGINFLTTTPLKICIGHPPVSATYGNFMPCKLLMTNNL